MDLSKISLTCSMLFIQLRRSVVIGHCNPDRSLSVEEKMKVAKQLLVFIPVAFILLRVWCTRQYFCTVYLVNIARNDGQCVPVGFKDGQLILGILQVGFMIIMSAPMFSYAIWGGTLYYRWSYSVSMK